jgi:hypothetical protein
MDSAMSDPDTKDLSVWTTYQQLFGGSKAILTHFKRSGFNVDRYNPPMIVCFDLRAHLRFVDFVSTSSKLFFAVAGLSNCHRLDLVATEPLYFSSIDATRSAIRLT